MRSRRGARAEHAQKNPHFLNVTALENVLVLFFNPVSLPHQKIKIKIPEFCSGIFLFKKKNYVFGDKKNKTKPNSREKLKQKIKNYPVCP